MIQIINGIKESINNNTVANNGQGSLADADPEALVALAVWAVLAAAFIALYVVYGRRNRR